jgi:hypothetical protein
VVRLRRDAVPPYQRGLSGHLTDDLATRPIPLFRRETASDATKERAEFIVSWSVESE